MVMFRALAFIGAALAFALISLAPAPFGAVQEARAQGNCPNCDLPPGCRGNGNGNGGGNGGGNGNGNGGGRNRNCQRLSIDIQSDIDFGRIVIVGSGGSQIMLDLDTGQKVLIGDADDLGGMPITGRAVILGAPFENVRVRLPSQVAMRDRAGGNARIRDFVTNLPGFPRLDADGRLEFRFSGTLVIDADTRASGNLRGRVPISVEYP